MSNNNNNSNNPNKRRLAFTTQQQQQQSQSHAQRRPAKRQKLNVKLTHNAQQAGRGRGRGRSVRGSRGRGRGRGQYLTQAAQPPPTVTNMKTQTIVHKPVPVTTTTVSTVTPTLAQPRLSRTVQLQNIAAPVAVAVHVEKPALEQTETAAETAARLRQLLFAKMSQTKPKVPMASATTTTTTTISIQPAPPSSSKPMVINPFASDSRIISGSKPMLNRDLRESSDKQQMAPTTRQFKSYRTAPKSADNITFTNTLFDAHGRAEQTYTTANVSQTRPNVITHAPSVAATSEPNLPPKLMDDDEDDDDVDDDTTADDEPAAKLPMTAVRWSCPHCTYINENSTSAKCAMCHHNQTPLPASMQSHVQSKQETQITKTMPPPPQPRPNVSAKAVAQSANIVIAAKSVTASTLNRAKITPSQPPISPASPVVKDKTTAVSVRVQVKIEDKASSQVKPAVASENTDDIWAQRDKAMLERRKQSENDQEKKHAQKMVATVVKKQRLSAPPPMMEYWKTNQRHDWNGTSLQKFVAETDAFITRHNDELKQECDSLGLAHVDALNAQDQNSLIDIMSDFEWTQTACANHSVSWPERFDLRVFKRTITHCTR